MGSVGYGREGCAEFLSCTRHLDDVTAPCAEWGKRKITTSWRRHCTGEFRANAQWLLDRDFPLYKADVCIAISGIHFLPIPEWKPILSGDVMGCSWNSIGPFEIFFPTILYLRMIVREIAFSKHSKERLRHFWEKSLKTMYIDQKVSTDLPFDEN